MNILMMTNTYHPIVGGLEKSVEIFADEFRKKGHNVLIVCPEFEGAPEKENDVFRVPAIQNFNNTDFSVELPISSELKKVLRKFKPHIVHSHHPFLIGDTALRTSAEFNIPIIFTNHTLYEENTHYVPGDSKAIKKFVIELSSGYANLCDRVIAPSQSIAQLLQERGVDKPLHVIPTGIYLDKFDAGCGKSFRKFFDIPKDAFVTGIIGRVAPEKNIMFLSKAMKRYLEMDKKAYFIVVGDGTSLEDIRQLFKKSGLSERLIMTGSLKGPQLISAYKALDVFVFASHSETQGLVLVEAMATGTPVVGVDAPGVREVLINKKNGRMIRKDNIDDFTAAIQWIKNQSPSKRGAITKASKKTAKDFSVTKCVNEAMSVYELALEEGSENSNTKSNKWKKMKRVLKAQAGLMSNFSKATGNALKEIPEGSMDKLKEKIKKVAKKAME